MTEARPDPRRSRRRGGALMTALALAALAVALIVTSAGLALRLGGALAFWAGTAALATGGDPRAIWVAALGGAAWLAGQAHFALRHRGEAKGPVGAALLAGAAALLRRAGRAAASRGRPERPSAHDGTEAGR